ncbi:SOS response-associated peptidase [Magnetospirillum sp. 15-1]|uniref:SOS response-associated peptidase n=1 Tax=Magnetospirillum sp. 15-1 TaxID=1979370 RepID=UPI000BBC5161|nr:SOS response-associated peptidase [Magnetospirillum sp. 15-1]
MCSRFELKADPAALMRRFGLTVPPPWPLGAERRPTDPVLVIGKDGGDLLPWGLTVEWQAALLINARAETLAVKPTFRPLLAGGRVLIPASAWWEWQVAGRGRLKTRLALAGEPLFALAGLSDGRRVVIVTCAPADDLAAVHDRMPVVLPPEAEAAWIDGARPFDAVAPLLRPHAGPFTITAEPGKPSAQGDLFG